MKHYLFYILFALIPVPAGAAVMLANCDNEPHTVIIRNSGSERTVTLTKNGGEIEEYGPISGIAFQIKDKDPKKQHPLVTPLSPYEELCIWSGEIKIQRLDTGGNGSGGGVFR